MSDLRDYLDAVDELPDEVTIGRVVMFTITDEQVKREDLISWFAELGLNPQFLPREIKPVDAFKKATSQIDEHEYARADGTRGILLTRPVTTDREMVCRFIVREIRNTGRRRLDHHKAIEATFYKGTKVGGKIRPGSERIRLTRVVDNLDPSELSDIDTAIAKITDLYDRYVNFLDGQKIRAVIRDYLKYLNAIEIKGGVYFVHKNRVDELTKLVEVVNRLGGGCRAYQIPLVDMENERKMVVEAFEREAEDALNELVRRITHVRQTRGKVTPAAYAKLKDEYDTVLNRAMEYQRTLNLSQVRTAAAGELALDALSALQHDLLKGGAP